MRARLLLLAASACALLISPAVAGATTPGRSPDDAVYTLDLRFGVGGGGTLKGTESIRFRNTSATAMTSVWLRTWANGPAGCAARRIRVAVRAPARRGDERTGCTSLQVLPSRPIPSGALGAISLEFTVTSPPTRDRFGRSLGDYMLGNAIPILAVEDARGLHIGEPYFSEGESFYSLSSNWHATILLSRDLSAATTGTTTSTTSAGALQLLTVEANQARDFALVIGRLELAREQVDGTTVNVWWHTASGRDLLLRSTARALRVLSADAGPYRPAELDVVESFTGFGGMEYPGLVMTEPSPDIVVHEVAHQWWFGMVGDDEYTEPWLDESFATYSEHLIQGRPPTPCDVGDPLAPWSTPLDTSVAFFRRHALAYDEVYSGGACVLYAYERAVGLSSIRALLHLLLRRFGGSVETTDDVVQAMRETMPAGFDLTSFLARARILPGSQSAAG